MLAASRSQAENSCFMNSVAALASNNPLDWTRGDFDDILNEGQRLYKDHLRAERLAQGSLLYFDTLEGREVIVVGGRRVRVEVDFLQYGATIGHVAGHAYEDRHQPLEVSLGMIFEQCSKAIIIIEEKWMAIRKHGDRYNIINSHAIGELGELLKGRVARSHSCETLEQVAAILAAGGTRGLKTQYYVHPVVITHLGK